MQQVHSTMSLLFKFLSVRFRCSSKRWYIYYAFYGQFLFAKITVRHEKHRDREATREERRATIKEEMEWERVLKGYCCEIWGSKRCNFLTMTMLLGFQQVRELPKHSAFGRRKEKKREKKCGAPSPTTSSPLREIVNQEHDTNLPSPTSVGAF